MKYFLRKKHFVFRCDNNGKVVSIAAINFLEACEKLHNKLQDFEFTLLTIL